MNTYEIKVEIIHEYRSKEVVKINIKAGDEDSAKIFATAEALKVAPNSDNLIHNRSYCETKQILSCIDEDGIAQRCTKTGDMF